MNRLLVHGTLRKGQGNHHLMGTDDCEDVVFNGRPAEIYNISDERLHDLDVFEALCGWRRVHNEEHNAFVYIVGYTYDY
jgi:gamma-glutamylcyclotransferase (GGCT)/AIG2-like uncharacterized protein YtfP